MTAGLGPPTVSLPYDVVDARVLEDASAVVGDRRREPDEVLRRVELRLMREAQRPRRRERQRCRRDKVGVETETLRGIGLGFDRLHSFRPVRVGVGVPALEVAGDLVPRRQRGNQLDAAMIRFAVESRTLQPERLDQVSIDECMLRRDLRRRATGDLPRDPARFQHRHRVSGLQQQVRRRQAHDATADDRHVGAIRLLVTDIARLRRARDPTRLRLPRQRHGFPAGHGNVAMRDSATRPIGRGAALILCCDHHASMASTMRSISGIGRSAPAIRMTLRRTIAS